MDLKIKDVAELLSVSETTVRRLITDGKIPAYKLNRQYRFSKIEVENWMMEQKLSHPPHSLQETGEEQIFPVPQKELSKSGNQQFSLYRALNRGGIHILSGASKEEVIPKAMEEIAPILRLDPSVTAELLLDRERLMPTAFNNGVAVPHSRECLQKIPYDLISIVLLEKPIEYGALDEKPVDLLFFLFASEDKMHLHLLSKIAHLSSSAKALEFLKTRPTKSALLDYIRNWESTLRA